MTPRNCWRVLALVLLLCALLVPFPRPAADGADRAGVARPVAFEPVAALSQKRSLELPTVIAPTPTPTLDWSGFVVAMSVDSIVKPNPAPPAPPLSLPESEPALPTTTEQSPTAFPTATAALPTVTAIPVTAVATATIPQTAVLVPPFLTATVSPAPAIPATEVQPTAVPAPTVAANVAPTSTLDTRGRQALAGLGYDINSIGYTISFHRHTGSHRGLTFTNRKHIEIYIKPTTSNSELSYIVGHEVGHAVDHMRNTQADRDRWMQSRGITPGTSWWPTDIAGDYATPAGDFAECFASWRLGSPSHSSWGGCGTMNALMAELATS